MTQCPKGYRWAQPGENLLPGACAWYDEDPETTDFPFDFEPPPVGGVIDPPFEWLIKQKGPWPSGGRGVLIRESPKPAAVGPDSPFRVDPAKLPQPMQVKIRPQHVVDLLSELFPGATVHTRDSLGGKTYEFSVWRYEMKISVSLEAMSDARSSASGSATLTFAEYPKDKGTRSTVISQFTTGHLPDLRAGVEKAKAMILGVAQSLMQACTKPPKPRAKSVMGGYLDDP